MKDSKTPRFVRMNHLVGNKLAIPPVPGLLPMSAATVWRMVADGSFPAPVKLGKNTTAWRLSDIDAWAEARASAASKRVRTGVSR